MSAIFSCSIDDGHPLDHKMAALLDACGLAATFYFPLKNSEGAPVLAAPDMRTIGQRFEIGSHTHDHCFLSRLDAADARRQISVGKARLEALLGRPVDGFCYPGGQFRPAHVGMVKAAGFAYARTTMNLRFDTGADCYRMPTTLQFYPHPRAVYVRNFIRAGHWRQRHDGLLLAMRNGNWLTRLYALFGHAHARHQVFHLWAHSSDVDRLGLWRELRGFLRHVAAHVPPEYRLENRQLAALALARSRK